MFCEVTKCTTGTFGYFFSHGETAPIWPGHPHYRSFTITDTSHSVGLLWTSVPTQRPLLDNTQHSQERHPWPWLDPVTNSIL